MTLLITQEGIFYDKEDLASNKTYLFYLSLNHGSLAAANRGVAEYELSE